MKFGVGSQNTFLLHQNQFLNQMKDASIKLHRCLNMNFNQNHGRLNHYQYLFDTVIRLLIFYYFIFEQIYCQLL